MITDRYFRYLAVIFFLYFFYGCASQSSEGKGGIANNIDTVYKDIPSDIQSKNWYKLFLKERTKLNLAAIDNGYDSLQIRFWIRHGYGEDSANRSQLIVLRKTFVGIVSELYSYSTKYDSNWDSILSIDTRIDTLMPKSGWGNFNKELESTAIYNLPHYNKISGYYLGNDSDGIIIEIATNRKYRIYYYPDYIQYKDKIEEAGKMYKIMRLIEDEFNIKVVY